MSERTFRLSCAGTAIAVALFLVLMVANWGGTVFTRFVDDWGEFVAAAIGSGLCWYAARRHHRHQRIGWTLLSLSTGAWALGEIVWSWYETVLHQITPFPSLADAGYLSAVPLEIAGVMFLAVGLRSTSRLRMLLDGLIIAGGVFFVSWLTVLHAVYAAGASSTFALALSLAYPVGDVVTAVIVLTLVSHSKRLDGPLLLIAAGLFALTLSDSMFAYLTSTNSYFGNPVDTGWLAGFLIIGLGAMRSTLPRSPGEDLVPRAGSLRVLIPYLPLVAAGLLTVIEVLRGGRLDTVAIWTAASVVALVLLRQLLTVWEISSLTKDLESSLGALQDREAKLEYQAFHDNLTNLANRQLFQDRVQHALARTKRSQEHLGLLFLDLDDFKNVNDTMGHASGDLLIIAAAERLRGCVRPADTVARLGGDEFAVLLEDLAGPSDAQAAAQRVLEAFQAPFNLQKEVYVSISIGIVVTDGQDSATVDPLRDADTAMYAAKSAGKARYALFEENLRVGFADRLEMRNRLAKAIEERELTVAFQPVFDVGSKRLVGAEALARWECEGQPVSPAEFIPLAEETGLITALGRLVLETACREAAGWSRRAESHGITLSVNVSAHQLNHAGFVADVCDVLERTGLDPARLVLEITENALMLDTDLVLDRLNSLAAVGVRLAIDDFGTGYSALHYLQRFPVSIVKIDRSFVDGLPSATNRAVVASISSLCQSLGMISVAEGIETDKQFAELRRLGCKAGQGFLLARPMPPQEMSRLAEEITPRREARRAVRQPPLAEASGTH